MVVTRHGSNTKSASSPVKKSSRQKGRKTAAAAPVAAVAAAAATVARATVAPETFEASWETNVKDAFARDNAYALPVKEIAHERNVMVDTRTLLEHHDQLLKIVSIQAQNQIRMEKLISNVTSLLQDVTASHRRLERILEQQMEK